MGILNKILGSILKSRTKTVLDVMKNDPGLTKATKELIDASNEWKKELKKSRGKLPKKSKDRFNRLRGK